MRRFVLLATFMGLCNAAEAKWHTVDTAAPFGRVSLSELMRVIQLYNSTEFHCANGTEDGYGLGDGLRGCDPHDLDYNSQDWSISLGEILRAIQLYNWGDYFQCPGESSEDGYCEGSVTVEEGEGSGGGEDIYDSFIHVPAGTFFMGRPYTGTGYSDELPVHRVDLDAYLIGRYEVTNQQVAEVLNWAYAQGYLDNRSGGAFNGKNVHAYGQFLLYTYSTDPTAPIEFTSCRFTVRSVVGMGGSYSLANHPAVWISWYGCIAYLNWRSEMEGLEPVYDTSNWTRHSPLRNGYRLPTEAEWERAAAWDGKRHWRYGFKSDSISVAQANFDGYDFDVNPLGLTKYPYTSPVGWFNGVNISPNGDVQTQYSVSPVGACDMSGNVSEWCEDWWDPDYYASSPRSNPDGPSSGEFRVLRGGSWLLWDLMARTAHRDSLDPSYGYRFAGFRAARTP